MSRKKQSGASARSRPRYGERGNGLKRSPIALVVLAALVVGGIWFAAAGPVHDRVLATTGEKTVGTPTGAFTRETTGRNRPLFGGPRVTYFLEYSYDNDGVEYTGAGSTGYSFDDRPERIDESRRVDVFFDPEHPRDSYIPDGKQE